jgi:hypothetical protein
MLIATGAGLVLATWIVVTAVLLLIGLAPAIVTQEGRVSPSTLRRAMWWGLLLITVAIYVVALFWPLQSAGSAIALLTFSALFTAAGLLMAKRRSWHIRENVKNTNRTVLASALFGVAALAVAAIGPVTNYDSGLYHLGAISYAAEFSTIPGLANLYAPLGYSSAEFPLAAALGIGPWSSEGFRLLNGLVIAMVVVDLLVRFKQKTKGPGRFIELVGVSVLLISMVALADYWVTSPTQDSAVFALTIAAVAYLADAIFDRQAFTANSAVLVVLCLLLVLIRPNMIAFGLAAGVVIVLLLVRRRENLRYLPLTATSVLVVFIGVLVALVATVRDYVLSGWLQYPLSFVSFNVPWRADDPTPLREATLGFHRNPDDLWGSLNGYEWVLPWMGNAVNQWELWAFTLMVVASVVALTIATRRASLSWRLMMLSMFPSAISLIFWWLLTPPSFRFAWGPLFTFAAVPLGWAVWSLVRTESRMSWSRVASLGFSVPIILVVIVTMTTRVDWASMDEKKQWRLGLEIPYVVTPITQPDISMTTLESGLEVLVPLDSELCWGAFPMCTSRIAESVRLAGSTLEDGLLP